MFRRAQVDRTFPEPVTPSVATTASVPSPPCGDKTPSTIGTTCVELKTSIWLASSSKTWVKANFSIALRRSVGGFRVICEGSESLSWASSTLRIRSVCAAPGGGGRSRRYTSKRLCEVLCGGSIAAAHESLTMMVDTGKGISKTKLDTLGRWRYRSIRARLLMKTNLEARQDEIPDWDKCLGRRRCTGQQGADAPCGWGRAVREFRCSGQGGTEMSFYLAEIERAWFWEAASW